MGCSWKKAVGNRWSQSLRWETWTAGGSSGWVESPRVLEVRICQGTQTPDRAAGVGICSTGFCSCFGLIFLCYIPVLLFLPLYIGSMGLFFFKGLQLRISVQQVWRDLRLMSNDFRPVKIGAGGSYRCKNVMYCSLENVYEPLRVWLLLLTVTCLVFGWPEVELWWSTFIIKMERLQITSDVSRKVFSGRFNLRGKIHSEYRQDLKKEDKSKKPPKHQHLLPCFLTRDTMRPVPCWPSHHGLGWTRPGWTASLHAVTQTSLFFLKLLLSDALSQWWEKQLVNMSKFTV